ncbi:MAG: HNH endonuclease family protein [Aquiluna sp.]|nr:HNH endonuclease family protein [Aquiluna sp.]
MRRWGYGLAGLLALVVIAGVASPETATQETPSSSHTQTAEPTESAQSAEPTPAPAQPAATTAPQDGELAALLTQLVIEDEFPSGYDRDLFRHWVDADRDGCDARREVLILEAVVAPTVGEGCSLSGGSWYSAFDGVTTNDPSLFDIDHMVPLKEAWDSGAHAWDSDRRRAFANDLDLPQALLAVSRSSNRSKGADDPAEWLPPLVSYHCQYIEDWMVVKIKWELSVDAREFSALRSIASGC